MIDIIPNWHPVLVHFSIGLFITAVLFYLARCLLPNDHNWRVQWLNMANWSLWTGCLITVGTVIAGMMAYNSVDHDSASHLAMNLHRNWALPTASLFILLGIAAIRLARAQKKPGVVFLSVSAIAGAMLITTAYLGAEVVYRHGIGVMSLPEIEAGGHHHEHTERSHDHHDDEAEGHVHEH
jgi:uncharacterized membrane protein